MYKNIVYVGRNIISAKWDQIICDGYECTKTAIKHLIELGHQQIAYIGETANEIRYQGYIASLKENGLEFAQNRVVNCRQNSVGGYQGAQQLILSATSLPTAVFCANDTVAIGALKSFTEAKIKVPDQISIISIDNIQMSGYVTPMLSTIEVPIAEMGTLAVSTLIGRLKKAHKLPIKIFLPCRLIQRDSVANLNLGSYI